MARANDSDPSMSTSGSQPTVTAGCHIEPLRGRIKGVRVDIGRLEIRSLICRWYRSTACNSFRNSHRSTHQRGLSKLAAVHATAAPNCKRFVTSVGPTNGTSLSVARELLALPVV